MVSLLDFIGQVEDSVVREGLIKFLVYATWREHRDVSMIRAVFGTVDFPTAGEFERGKRESYQVLYAYDVTFRAKTGSKTSAVVYMQAAWKRVIDFFFPIESDEWLTVLRIGLAFQVLLYCFACAAIGIIFSRGLAAG